MISTLLRASQYCYKNHLGKIGSLFEKLMILTCSAHISGKAKIHRKVSFSHGGIGVIVNPASEIGEGCIISAKVTLGNAFPHGGAPKLGKYVYVGIGGFLGGGINIADHVVIGANSVLTKDITEPGVVVAGVPAKIIRKLTPEELKMLEW